jgi:predicted Zn-dependent protease
MHARWLYFSWPEAEMRPAFEWLLDSTSAAPGLTVRAATTHWPAVVYEIGPGFGQEPAWMGNDTLVAVHRARARVLTNDRNVEARAFLAMHEFSLGNHDAAQMYIDQLLKLGPNDLEILMLAAENRLQLQDPDGALSYYERADRLRPGTAEVRIGRGWVAAMKGDDASAAQYWAPVVSASTDPVTLQRMMITFARVGDLQRVNEAREALRALSGAPGALR